MSRQTGEDEFFARTPEFEPLKGLRNPRSDNIFHAKRVILMMSVYSLVIAREYEKGIKDAPSRNE